jgi:hypothetical protein
MLAKFVVLTLRTIVMLEELHDDKMNFTNNRAFQPLPAECRRTADKDEALDANSADASLDEDSESA